MRFEETIGISHLITGLESRMRVAVDSALCKHGMSLAQYSALSALEMGQPLTNADMARACGVTPQTMNRIVSALLRAELIKKADHGAEHGLKVNYQMTPRALRLLCKAHTVVDKVERESLKGVGKEALKTLMNSLETIRFNLTITD